MGQRKRQGQVQGQVQSQGQVQRQGKVIERKVKREIKGQVQRQRKVQGKEGQEQGQRQISIMKIVWEKSILILVSEWSIFLATACNDYVIRQQTNLTARSEWALYNQTECRVPLDFQASTSSVIIVCRQNFQCTRYFVHNRAEVFFSFYATKICMLR